MAGIWYRAGTVAVTSGSTKVVGTGTTWRSGVYKPDKGHIFWGPDGRAYEVDYVESDAVLYLVTAYVGGSATGQAYSIVISITGQVPAFSRELSAFVAYHQSQMDGWQQLLTGTGDVPLTAPDGTKLTVPSWEKVMNAGTGVVAQAKTEAQNAAASAAAAGNAVVAAAMPLPDVWAPLSDSLRMITGYGRDVLFGSDVVARMVNFSRNTTATYIGKDGTLKTAAVNEPRFEKEGLLIEGQSTNLHTMSETTSSEGNGAGTVTATTLDGSPALLFQNTNGIFASVPQGTPTLTINSVYTVSVFTDKSIAECTIGVIAGINSPIVTLTSEIKLGNGLYRRWGTFTSISATNTCHYYVSTVSGGCKIGRIQVEAIPFASSYIPTNGAAVTRAQDICWIPVENNGLSGINNEKTVSIISDIIGIGGSYNFILSTPWGAIGYTATHERVAGTTVALNMNTPVALKTSVRKAARFTKGGGCSAVFGAIKKDGPTANWSISTTRVMIGCMSDGAYNPHFGHVKDLKIWLKPLSDEQMKAIT